jgi:hypothetical protein
MGVTLLNPMAGDRSAGVLDPQMAVGGAQGHTLDIAHRVRLLGSYDAQKIGMVVDGDIFDVDRRIATSS